MVKKKIIVPLLLLCSMLFAVPVMASEPKADFVYDDAELFTQSEADSISEKISDFTSETGWEIYAFTYRQTGERELALDLTQEIFITVLQGIYAFDEKKAGFRTWAYRVAANRITDYYRSKSYKKEKLQQPLQWETEEEETVRDLAEHMVQKEQIRRIMDIVVSYEREWIRIFQKKCFEEKTFAQIAEEMELAESTVKTRFYQMLKRIRREVQR